MEKKKADKEERRTNRKKKTLQKAKQDAGIPTDSEDEFTARAAPTVCRSLPLSIYNQINFLVHLP